METYVKQLIADLEAAQKMKVPPISYGDNTHVATTSMAHFSGMEKSCFPPAEKLSETQAQALVEAILELFMTNKYCVKLPARLPYTRAYQKIVDRWDEIIHHYDSGLCRLCYCTESNPAECDMREWCDWDCFDEDDIPDVFYDDDDFYDGDENRVNFLDVLDVPMPDLCLTCESFLDDDWDENLLCHMNRSAKREEGEKFKCGVWREKLNIV